VGIDSSRSGRRRARACAEDKLDIPFKSISLSQIKHMISSERKEEKTGGSAETRSLESAPSEETRQKAVQQKKSKADWTRINSNTSQRRLGLGGDGGGG